MRRAIIYVLFILSFVFLISASQAAQTKGIKVVIKDQSGRKVGLYKGIPRLVTYSVLILKWTAQNVNRG